MKYIQILNPENLKRIYNNNYLNAWIIKDMPKDSDENYRAKKLIINKSKFLKIYDWLQEKAYKEKILYTNEKINIKDKSTRIPDKTIITWIDTIKIIHEIINEINRIYKEDLKIIIGYTKEVNKKSCTIDCLMTYKNLIIISQTYIISTNTYVYGSQIQKNKLYTSEKLKENLEWITEFKNIKIEQFDINLGTINKNFDINCGCYDYNYPKYDDRFTDYDLEEEYNYQINYYRKKLTELLNKADNTTDVAYEIISNT